MLALVWISPNGEEYVFPKLLRGQLRFEETEGRASAVLTSVRKYTWENYHGKLLPSGKNPEEVLWDPHPDVDYSNLRVGKRDGNKIFCFTADDSERVCFQLFDK